MAHTSPDGYNLLLGYVGNLAIGPALHRKLPFDPLRDFAAITQLASAPNVLVVYPSVPVRTFNEFIEYVKARPQQINFASAVVGSPGHLAGEYLKHTAGLQMAHIPYKGAAQAVIDLLGGQVHAMFGVSTVMPHVKTGKLRALATTGLKRFSLLPDVPTIAESGFPGFEATAWYGFLAASGTPKAIVSRLHDETARALQTSFVTSKLKPLGFELVGSTPEAFAMYIRAETKKWGEIVKSAGIKAD